MKKAVEVDVRHVEPGMVILWPATLWSKLPVPHLVEAVAPTNREIHREPTLYIRRLDEEGTIRAVYPVNAWRRTVPVIDGAPENLWWDE